jgi:signal peptidase I
MTTMSATNDIRVGARFPVLRRIYRSLRAGFALFGLVVLIYAVGFDLSRVVSPSMSPALQGQPTSGDWVLTERVSYWFGKPKRWEVVRFLGADGLPVMKRVVGLPGETIKIAEGAAIVNGTPLTVPPSLSYLHYYAYGPKLYNGLEANCGRGYYVFGDDSKDSDDSRYNGELTEDRVTGRAWLRVWPPNRIGFLNP